MNRIQLACRVWRHLGPRFVGLRVWLALRQRLGLTGQVFADRPWADLELSSLVMPEVPQDIVGYAKWKSAHAPRFIIPWGQPPALPADVTQVPVTRQPSLAERMELLAADRCTYFCAYPSPCAVDWYANPFEKTRADGVSRWSEIPDYRPEQGDPRWLWEPARAAWALDCGKAAARRLADGNDPATIYWRWLDSWMNASPPYRGFHWKCGQESAVRFMVATIGFWSLARDPATTADRHLQILRLAWATGFRIEHHLDYAISQNNNHSLSEACGLMLIGHLFPELHESRQWWQLGKRTFERELHRQVYADGSYIQHSLNYQRVMLHDALLALRLAELADDPFPRASYDLLSRSGRFLYQLMDPVTGRVPQYGNNDGAYVLPFSECEFWDFRPVIQATYFLTHRQRFFPAGPWDEDLWWLFGDEMLAGHAPAPAPKTVPEPQTSQAFSAGGYVTLRQADSHVMIRCHTYRHRPAHCDPLHVDMWWRGQNVLRDCGTYRYYNPGHPQLENYFRSLAAHNTLEIDGSSPYEFVSRFLWFPWPQAELRRFVPTDSAGCQGWLEAECHDYHRRPWRCRHRRSVVSCGDGAWVVIDDVLGTGTHSATVRWHLLDAPYEVEMASAHVRLQTPAGPYCLAMWGTSPCSAFQVIRGRERGGPVLGLASDAYGQVMPIPTVEAVWGGVLPLRIVTAMAPGEHLRGRREVAGPELERWTLEFPAGTHTLEIASPHRSTGPIVVLSAGAGRVVTPAV